MKKKLLFNESTSDKSARLKWSMFALAFVFLSFGQFAIAQTDAVTVDGGTLNEDDFHFCVGDGEADNVSKVSVEGAVGPNMQWVVTDEDGKILGLPPTPEAVNFDEAPAGTCLIWHLSYADGLEGLEAGNNALTDLVGTYDLSDDNVRVYRAQPEAGELVGGPFAFDVDGTPDMVSGLSLSGDRSGTNRTFVITDDKGKILGLPPTMEAVEGVNFDGAGAGTCLIWYLRYEDGLVGLEPDLNANDLMGCFDLSNYIEVVRTEAVMVDGGTLNEDPFHFCVGDGEADNVSKVSVEGAVGPNMQWVVTDEDGKILGLPPTPEAVNFDEAPAGTCLIWHLSYADGLEGLEAGNNALTDLVGTYDLSDDNVRVYRAQPEAGELVGGPFAFDVDGTPDMVSGLSLSGDRSGTNRTFVITDDKGKILGLPPTMEAVEGVNFDGAGAGTCLIWYLRYEDGLVGLEPDLNANDLMGCFDLSNYIEVVRSEAVMVDGGTLNEDDFHFCVGDGEADNVSKVSVEGAVGPNMQWVVTDEDGKILGLPPTPEAVNFDEAPAGTCLIWHLSYADGLEGLEAGNNALTDLVGTYDLSDDNVRVYRAQPEAGELVGGPFAFDVDGTPDMVSGLSLSGDRSGTNRTFVITDDKGKILGLPPTMEAVEGVNFDGAGVGTCLIWYLRYEDGLVGLEPDLNANDLMGCFDLSNYIEVVRTEAVMVDGGTLNEDDFHFCVGDGKADNVSKVSVEGAVGPNMQWVVTDEDGKILGLPPTPEAVNFDEAPAGTCLIWHLSYADGLEGLEAGNNALTDLVGTYDLSDDNVRVYRAQPEAGELVGGPFEFTIDEETDNVYGIKLTGDRSGTNRTFVITDDKGKILGLPPTLEAVEGVDFNEAGAGTCLIWYLRYEDGLQGAEMGMNAHDLMGCYDLSNPIEVVRTEPEVIVGGEITGGPFDFCVGDDHPDNVSGVEVSGNEGSNSQWVITDAFGKILGLPPTPEAVNFDGAGSGLCLIWHLSYADGLEGLEAGNNVAQLEGSYEFSNEIEVNRSQPDAGELVGGPFAFDVDGEVDNVYGIELTGDRSGTNRTFVITDDKGKILGLPPTMEAVEGVNFDGAGAGTCLIWYLRYEDGLVGLEPDLNANDLIGCFDLSNYIEVVRTEAVMVDGGTLNEDPFHFCVGDGEADNVSKVSVEGAVGPNMQWVVTDEDGKILGLPPTPEAVNFDEAPAGTCLIWHLSYADGLEGLEAGNNALTDLVGTYDLSDDNVRVYRAQPEAGELVSESFEFIIDEEVDNVSGIELTGERSGTNSTFVITDDQGKILGLPPTMEAVEGVNFDGAGAGTCLIWYLRYEDGLVGLEPDLNANDLQGCFDLSNAIEVVRVEETGVSGKSSVTLFPLPATDVLNVSLKSFGNSDVQVTMVDLAGNSVKNSTKKVVDKSISLDVQSVPSGLYILNMTNGEGKSISKKVIIR